MLLPRVARWPNPSNGIVYVGNAAGAEVSVFDATGQLVKRIGSLTGTEVNLQPLVKGVYLLVVARPDQPPAQEKVVFL